MDPLGICFCILTYLFIFYAYYVLIGVVIIPLWNETAYGYINGISISILTILCIISHLKAMLSNPGYVSTSKANLNDKFDTNNENLLKEGLTICPRCEVYRSADSHHCRICKKCIKRRHHHCPWINNCIGELNQKYFIQFVFYIGVLCIYTISFVMTSLIMFPEESLSNSKLSPSSRVYHSVFVIVECVIFGIFVFAIMCEQISSVTSTITGQSINYTSNLKPKIFSNLFNKIKYKSYYKYSQFRQVFGKSNPILWLLPFEFKYYGKISQLTNDYSV